MVHQPAGGVSGQVSDIEIQKNEILRYRQLLNEILGRHCGKSAEQVAKDSDRDFFLTAQQAKEYGLVDEILSKPPVEASDEPRA
jgi:ATP-dependent Clp protease protease subunit